LDALTDDHITVSSAYMLTDDFKTRFTAFCQMDHIPEISLSQMKTVKNDFIERVITPDTSETLGNAARLLASWIDGALEYTVLKHEVIVLRLKSNNVQARIKKLSDLWPKKKEFIEGAYKILLFTKNQRRPVTYTINVMRERGMLGELFDYKEAVNKVLKRWYEQRIQEETERNQRLRLLHDGLTKIKELRELQNARQREIDMIEGAERMYELYN
jgi:hypothetical protein